MAAVLVVGIFAFTSAIPTEVNTSIVNNDSSVPVNNILPSAMADGADDDEDDDDEGCPPDCGTAAGGF